MGLGGSWSLFGKALGGVWDRLGRLLGTFGRLLVVFLLFLIEFFSSMSLKWYPKALWDQFWVDFEGFCKILAGFRGGFGGIFVSVLPFWVRGSPSNFF